MLQKIKYKIIYLEKLKKVNQLKMKMKKKSMHIRAVLNIEDLQKNILKKIMKKKNLLKALLQKQIVQLEKVKKDFIILRIKMMKIKKVIKI